MEDTEGVAEARFHKSAEEALVALLPASLRRDGVADNGLCRREGTAAPQGFLEGTGGAPLPQPSDSVDVRDRAECCLVRLALLPLSLVCGRSSCDLRRPRPSTTPLALGRVCSMIRVYLSGAAESDRAAACPVPLAVLVARSVVATGVSAPARLRASLDVWEAVSLGTPGLPRFEQLSVDCSPPSPCRKS